MTLKINDLPKEIIYEIAGHLELNEISKLSKVSKYFDGIINHESSYVWRMLLDRYGNFFEFKSGGYVKIKNLPAGSSYFPDSSYRKAKNVFKEIFIDNKKLEKEYDDFEKNFVDDLQKELDYYFKFFEVFNFKKIEHIANESKFKHHKAKEMWVAVFCLFLNYLKRGKENSILEDNKSAKGIKEILPKVESKLNQEYFLKDIKITFNWLNIQLTKILELLKDEELKIKIENIKNKLQKQYQQKKLDLLGMILIGVSLFVAGVIMEYIMIMCLRKINFLKNICLKMKTLPFLKQYLIASAIGGSIGVGLSPVSMIGGGVFVIKFIAYAQKYYK